MGLVKNPDPKFCTRCWAAWCTLKCPCKQGYYCGAERQRAEWALHKKKCAIALAKAVKEARHEHGREDFAVADSRFWSCVCQWAQVAARPFIFNIENQ